MSIADNYTFTLNVSQKAYPNKIPNNQVGKLTFTTQALTIKELENKVKEGYAFCYNFTKQSDILTMHDKTIAGFQFTNIIFFDFDHMTIPMQEFVKGLNFKPTFAYTSYSNAPEDNDYRYRLVYAFSDAITSVQDFAKVYDGIAIANGFEKVVDKRVVNQYYNGSKADCETFGTEIIYALHDFDNYVSDNTYSFPFENKDKKDVYTSYSEMENVPEISDEFRRDLELLTYANFMDRYMPMYEETYAKSLATELILKDDASCFIYPDNYFEVYRKHYWKDGKHYIEKWMNGEGRRRKLYLTAKIMVQNVPDMTIEQLVYNLVREKADYYDNSDGQLRNDVLIGIAERAFKYRHISIKSKNRKKYKVNKELWAAYGISPNSAKNIVRKQMNEESILPLYDFSKSVKDNLESLHALGIKVGKSKLYELVKKYKEDGKNASSDITCDFPFQNKEKEDVYTSYSQMESVPKEKTMTKEDEDFINSIIIKDDFEDDYDDSFEVDLFFRLRGL